MATTRTVARRGRKSTLGLPKRSPTASQAAEPGELTFEVNRRRVDEIVTATDVEILEAMRFLFDRMKLVTEPSGAIGVAALARWAHRSGRRPRRDRDLGRQRGGGTVCRAGELVTVRSQPGLRAPARSPGSPAGCPPPSLP